MRDKYRILREYFKEYLEHIKYRKLIPKNSRHDDIYIVEFPKSGVTWLSFIIANISLKQDSSSDQESVTFYNSHRYVIDVHQLRNSSINENKKIRFIKSHAEHTPYYYFVIYLLRNPFDVMVSYYNFMYDHGVNMDFEEFVKSEQYGISKWVVHINSWLKSGTNAQRIHLLKYENLKSDPIKEINNLYLNLGFSINDEIIKEALSLSDMTLMRESEDHYRKHNPNYNMSFVGSKNKRKKEDLLNDTIRKYIIENSKEILELYYPEELK